MSNSRLMNREAQIRSLFDASGFGLEIGPSDNPIVPKRGGFHVESVDHATAAELRAKFATEPVEISLIEEVDYIWDGRPLCEVIGSTQRYDYVVASHVIEHSPDMLGFLNQCDALLRPAGTLVLVVPDKRRCFDLFRPLSTTRAVLQAHYEKRTRHLAATAFEQASSFVTLDGVGGWAKGATGSIALRHSLSESKALFDRATASNDDLDFHASTFTPSSFRLVLKELNELELLPLHEVNFQPTPIFEFFITVSRTGTGCPLDRLQLFYRIIEELKESAPQPPQTGP